MFIFLAILASALNISMANHPGGKAFGDCVRTVHKIEWGMLGYQFNEIDPSTMNSKERRNFINMNEKVLGSVSQTCREGSFGSCYENVFKEYVFVLGQSQKNRAWAKAKSICIQHKADWGCIKIYKNFINPMPSKDEIPALIEKSAVKCSYFRFGDCIKFAVETEIKQLNYSEKDAYNNATQICHAIVFPDCIKSSYDLYMKGREKLTKEVWENIQWMCRR